MLWGALKDGKQTSVDEDDATDDAEDSEVPA
jgi:hypothetical protein